MLGIAVGVTALITVLSVINGFETELRERILSMTAHATIRREGGPMIDWPRLAALAEAHPEVVATAPYVQAEGMLSAGSRVAATLVRGVDPRLERRVDQIDEKMVLGRLEDLRPGAFGIVLGGDLARNLGVGPGDRVVLVTPQASLTPAGVMPRLRRFTVVGVFSAGMYEYDSALALVHIQDAQRLYRLGEAVTGLRLRLRDLFQVRQVVAALSLQLPEGYWVSDWTRQHANFFRAIQIEKTTMFVILTLIVGVAAFNLVSTLVMAVVDKEADIAILRTLGLTPAGVMAVFTVQGTVIGVVGTLLGVAGGVSLATNVERIVPAIERLFGIQFLSAEVYYISDLPSELHWDDVWLITGVALVLTLLASVYPAWRAARVQPAEALRYE